MDDKGNAYDDFNFQFLWGWNKIIFFLLQNVYPWHFQFLWGWNLRVDTRGERVLPRRAFQFLWGWNTLWTPKKLSTWCMSFQFLWGWNSSSFLTLFCNLVIFQFLWGWNVNNTVIKGAKRAKLSIPLRMKHTHSLRYAPISFLAFNSFEDETWRFR